MTDISLHKHCSELGNANFEAYTKEISMVYKCHIYENLDQDVYPPAKDHHNCNNCEMFILKDGREGMSIPQANNFCPD